MNSHVRAKRVGGPLCDEAKARLCGGQYSTTENQWENATCLSGLVQEFLAGTPNPNAAANGDDLDLDNDGSSGEDCTAAGDDWSDRDREAAEIVRNLMNASDDGADAHRRRLARDVAASIEALSWFRSSAGDAGFRRAVMSRLRVVGHNAGICRSTWESSGGLSAGSYEYIDVVSPSSASSRYIVDLDFSSEFEVARATDGYRNLLSALPKVAVASESAVTEVVRMAAEAARRSLRSRGLHVPPWRKRRYMMSKWIGPHRRTTTVVPSTAGVHAAVEVKCRSVGFGALSEMVVAPAL